MKISLLFLSIFIAFVKASPKKLHLRTYYEISQDIVYSTVDEDLKLLKNSNQNCVKQKLGLFENSNKIISHYLENFAFLTATAICLSDEDKLKVQSLEKRIKLIKKARVYLKDELNCIKNKLSQIEPTSELLQGFTPTNNPEEKCKSFEDVQAGLIKQLNGYKEIISALGLQNCSAISEYETTIKEKLPEFTIIALKQPPIQREINKMKQEMARDDNILNQNILECIFKKLKE